MTMIVSLTDSYNIIMIKLSCYQRKLCVSVYNYYKIVTQGFM